MLVYLIDRPGHYYASFGVGIGGVNIIDVRPHTTAIVTLVPRGKTGQIVLTPEGRQIAKSKLFIPTRAEGDRRDRRFLYVIRDSKVTFAGSPSSNHALESTATRR